MELNPARCNIIWKTWFLDYDHLIKIAKHATPAERDFRSPIVMITIMIFPEFVSLDILY